MSFLQELKAAVDMRPKTKTVEYNGKVFEFTMTPLTLAERARAQKTARSDDATDFALQLLAMKARNADGTKLIQPGEIAELKNEFPADLVEKLMLAIIQDEDNEEEEEEQDPKSSKRTSRKTAS